LDAFHFTTHLDDFHLISFAFHFNTLLDEFHLTFLYVSQITEIVSQGSGFGGLGVSVLVSGTQVQTRPKPSDFYGRKNPQHAFLRKGSKAVGPMSQICAM
jgi:hypothetical protein